MGVWVCVMHMHVGLWYVDVVDVVVFVVLEECDVMCCFYSGWFEGIGSRCGVEGLVRVRVDVFSFGDAWGVLVIVFVYLMVLLVLNTCVSADLHGVIWCVLACEFEWVVVVIGVVGDISTWCTWRV